MRKRKKIMDFSLSKSNFSHQQHVEYQYNTKVKKLKSFTFCNTLILSLLLISSKR